MNGVLLGILGLIILMFGIVIGAMIHGTFPATPGDWVSFAGAIIGSVVTVAGAIAAFEWQASSQRLRRRKMLADQLEEVIALCIYIQEPLPLSRAAKLLAQVEAGKDLIAAIRKLRNSLAWAQPDSRAAIEAYEIIKGLELGTYLSDPDNFTDARAEIRQLALDDARRVHAQATAARTILDFDD